MSLSFNDAEVLRLAGFIEWEISEFANATTPSGQPQPPLDINGETWQLALRSRREWTNDKINRGWTGDEIENSLMNYYGAKEGRSPFDFLKIEYSPPEKIDYKAAIRSRAQGEIAELKRL